MQRTFLTYRNGNGDLGERIEAAVAHFYQAHGELPATLTVHTTEVNAATTALQVLKLTVPVTGSGGVLVGEVWLQLPQPEVNDDEGRLRQRHFSL